MFARIKTQLGRDRRHASRTRATRRIELGSMLESLEGRRLLTTGTLTHTIVGSEQADNIVVREVQVSPLLRNIVIESWYPGLALPNTVTLNAASYGCIVFQGNGGNDLLDASCATVRIDAFGGEGNDTLIGGTGEDRLNGATGDDLLVGNAGADALIGDVGNDTYKFDSNTNCGFDAITEDRRDPGSDTLDFSGARSSLKVDIATALPYDVNPNVRLVISGLGMENIITGDGNDLLTGNQWNNRLDAGKGNDTLLAGSGADVLIGGEGNDELKGGQGPDTYAFNLSRYVGTDWITETTADEYDTLDFRGSAKGINLDMNSLGRVNDSLTLGLRAGWVENVFGTDGNDTIQGTNWHNTIDGGAGNDLINGWGGNDAISGGAGDDTIGGQDGNDTIDGGSGNDLINAHYGQDQIFGGSGDDKMYGGAGNDTLLGGDGNDLVYGLEDDDVLHGNQGMDTLYGNDGQDQLIGGADNDYLDGGVGNDYLGATVTVVQVEYRNGLRHDYWGEQWDDAGNDRMYGGSDSDTLRGGTGDDYLDGGSGDDDLGATESLEVAFNARWEFWGQGNDTIGGGSGMDTLRGGVGNDLLHGGDDGDEIYGGDGDDQLSGGGWSDTLNGGAGADWIYGGSEADLLIAGANDHAIDHLYGEGAGDEFEYDSEDVTDKSGTEQIPWWVTLFF